MGDFLRLLQTTAGGWRSIGGNPGEAGGSDGISSSSAKVIDSKSKGPGMMYG